MQPFPIPSQFALMGHTISVTWQADLIDRENDVGQARYRENVICLQANTPGVTRPQSQLEQTFFHELLHFIFEILGEEDLRTNEQLIDQMSGLLHQAFVTADYAEQTGPGGPQANKNQQAREG